MPKSLSHEIGERPNHHLVKRQPAKAPNMKNVAAKTIELDAKSVNVVGSCLRIGSDSQPVARS